MEKEQITPMMSRYLTTKEQYSDCILFYRLGDFYEMFFDDAKTASRELEIALTGKSCGLKERAPMCGVPYHSAASYISKLVEKGYKVAICEQVEDPKTAKGLVKREVVRIVTPGTIIEENMLDDKKNNYLGVIFSDGKTFGLAFSDVSVGEIYTTETQNQDDVMSELARYSPSEIVVNKLSEKFFEKNSRFNLKPEVMEEDFFARGAKKIVTEQFQNPPQMGDCGEKAVAGILKYIEHTQKRSVRYIDRIEVYSVSQFMEIDPATRRNLEITETMRDKTKRGSLLWVLDRTKTSMGARLLKQWVERPLLNPIEINKRLYSVEELFGNIMLRDDLRTTLAGIYDIARILSRISLKSVTAGDLLSLKQSLAMLPELKYQLSKTKSPILSGIGKKLDIMEDVRNLIENAICDDLSRGEIIKGGYNNELDKLKYVQKEGRSWIAEAEAEEKQQTGIKNLKIRYNKVFGYYIEVSNSYKELVPDTYIRKQTLVNCERYITPKLKEMENTILGAAEKIEALESQLFEEVRASAELETARLKEVCDSVAVTDVIASLAEAAYKYNYSMPEIAETGEIIIKDGRHPVVEKNLSDTMFVPNDTELNSDDLRLMIITGPNMAGKSTYMRQVALITLMAQIGSFVPASYAKITPVDRIFTRVGASDDIASGQSTFMLEMVEVAAILEYSTKNSLVILDEIGRGTSTFDGLSIAWAVAEYMQNKKKCGAKTLFATHYHEMTELEDKLEGVKNYSIAVKKRGDDITFLRKIIRGGADDSYGIEVAALAGVPAEVIKRAKEILKKVENDDMPTAVRKSAPVEDDLDGQLDFGDGIARQIAEELKTLDVTTYTPIEAMNKLYELSKRAQSI